MKTAFPPHPLLLEINTRTLLRERSDSLGRDATLDDISTELISSWASQGFTWIWMLSVWTTGPMGRQISRNYPGWQSAFAQTLPDLTEADIGGSGFAIADYSVAPELGGDDALARLRERLKAYGLRLMLDFVPNHMGPDHPWVREHPAYFVQGSEADQQREPQNYIALDTVQGNRIFAHGRDPYFDGWPDTVQLDYSEPKLVEAMQQELHRIAGQCDGLRCDMAMLPLPEVFQKTWGRAALPFWADIIRDIRAVVPDFTFMAEVYWDMEWVLQQLGFQFTYDKRLYDRLHQKQTMAVVQHLFATPDFQSRSVRFLENHDEPRAATAFSWPVHQAAAVVTYTLPGMRFFHQGQNEGHRSHISPHLVRAPREETDTTVAAFYQKLLPILDEPLLHEGRWNLLSARPAWFGNDSHEAFIASGWKDQDGQLLISVVNYADHASQCYLAVPVHAPAGMHWRFKDLTGDAVYDREAEGIEQKGLYLDMPPWQYHIFQVTLVSDNTGQLPEIF